MGRKDTQVLLDEEVRAEQAETRRTTAEAGFLTATEDKKRVLGEIAGLEKKIQDKKEILEKSEKELSETEKNLEIVKAQYIKENTELEKIRDAYKLAETEFADFIKNNDIKKAGVLETISSLEKSHIEKKEQYAKEIQVLEGSKKAIAGDIENQKLVLENLRNEEVVFAKKNKDLESQSELLQSEISGLESDKQKLEDEIEDNKTVIEGLGITIKQREATIAERTAEIEKLEASTAAKQAEYKEAESKLFTIVKREEALNQKEEFIKSQFERAGIKWEE